MRDIESNIEQHRATCKWPEKNHNMVRKPQRDILYYAYQFICNYLLYTYIILYQIFTLYLYIYIYIYFYSRSTNVWVKAAPCLFAEVCITSRCKTREDQSPDSWNGALLGWLGESLGMVALRCTWQVASCFGHLHEDSSTQKVLVHDESMKI